MPPKKKKPSTPRTADKVGKKKKKKNTAQEDASGKSTTKKKPAAKKATTPTSPKKLNSKTSKIRQESPSTTPKRKTPMRSKSDEGPTLIPPKSPPKKKLPSRAKSGGALSNISKKKTTTESPVPPKRSTSSGTLKKVNAAGHVELSDRASRLVNSKAASMMHVNSPTQSSPKKSVFSSLPDRLKRSRPQPENRDYVVPLRDESSDAGKPKPIKCSKRTLPTRSRSGDLESLSESNMKQQRSGLPPRSSILRHSSHRSILRNSSHSNGGGGGENTRPTLPMRRGMTKARFTATQSEADAKSYDDGDSDSESDIEMEMIKFGDEEDAGINANNDAASKPRSVRPGFYSRPGLNKSSSTTRPSMKKSKSVMDLSAHSDIFKSSLDVMSTDKVEIWPDDPTWKKVCRYLRLLPPHPDEGLEKRKIRIFIWATLLLDFVAAMVSITTYSGVTECCGVPIFSLVFVNVNWSGAIRIITYVYLVMIFAEIIPVVRKGIPFNLLNPMVGFLITFAMFFDDRITEAILMWIIEATAIFFEFLVFRLQAKMYHDRYDKLDVVQQHLKSTRELRASSHHKSTRNRNKNNMSTSRASSSSMELSDDDSISGHSFGDDGENAADIELAASGGLNSSSGSINRLNSSAGSIGRGGPNHKLREARLLRERRQLRLKQKEDRKHLNYHLAGVLINFFLVGVSFTFIVVIASSGGLCVRSGQRPVVFSMNQLETCNLCPGEIINGRCEICNQPNAGDYQCYYQYI